VTAAFLRLTVIIRVAPPDSIDLKNATLASIGTFNTDCVVQNHVRRERQAKVAKILVDTGSEHTWISAAVLDRIGVAREKKDVLFVMANGQQITRTLGFAILRVGRHFTIDEVVFGEKGDLMLLGARTLEGLNLVDTQRRKLVAAGPIPAAATRPPRRR
jgi:predicted aspartyl protease